MSIDSDGSGSSQLPDPEQKSQNRRIDAILDARDNVLEQDEQAFELLAQNMIDRDMYNRLYRKAVKRYALESEQALREHRPEEGTPEDWSDTQEAAERVWAHRSLGVWPFEHRDNIEVAGIQSYLALSAEMTEAWVTDEDSAIGGSSQTQRQRRHVMPREISEQAFRALNYWWHTADIGITIDTGPTEAKAPYKLALDHPTPDSMGSEDESDEEQADT